MEQKGLDIVRRDWCPLCKDVGNHALRAILSGAPREEVVASIHEHLADVKDKVRLCGGGGGGVGGGGMRGGSWEGGGTFQGGG